MEDMTRAAEEAQMMKRDYVGMLRGYMELEEAVEVKHQKGSPIHRTWLEVLNRGLLLDPSSDPSTVHMAVGEATRQLAELSLFILRGIVEIQLEGGVLIVDLRLFNGLMDPSAIIPNWHRRKTFSVLPPVAADKIITNQVTNQLGIKLTELRVFVSTGAPSTVWLIHLELK